RSQIGRTGQGVAVLPETDPTVRSRSRSPGERPLTRVGWPDRPRRRRLPCRTVPLLPPRSRRPFGHCGTRSPLTPSRHRHRHTVAPRDDSVITMQTDVLGFPYEQRTIDLGRDDEGPVVATLVRRRASTPTRRAVLWLHGLADYFFQTHVADFFGDRGYDFYALDLRKSGRSWREHQTPNFCRSLDEYLPDLDQAAQIIRHDDGHDTLVVMAHSTGGLIASLWVHRRRSARLVDALILNSPFFDLNLPWLISRPAMETALRLSRYQPYRVIPRPVYPVYGESLHVDFRGEWSYDLSWKPVGGFPIRLGWLGAVHAAQRRLRAGLSI